MNLLICLEYINSFSQLEYILFLLQSNDLEDFTLYHPHKKRKSSDTSQKEPENLYKKALIQKEKQQIHIDSAQDQVPLNKSTDVSIESCTDAMETIPEETEPIRNKIAEDNNVVKEVQLQNEKGIIRSSKRNRLLTQKCKEMQSRKVKETDLETTSKFNKKTIKEKDSVNTKSLSKNTDDDMKLTENIKRFEKKNVSEKNITSDNFIKLSPDKSNRPVRNKKKPRETTKKSTQQKSLEQSEQHTLIVSSTQSLSSSTDYSVEKKLSEDNTSQKPKQQNALSNRTIRNRGKLSSQVPEKDAAKSTLSLSKSKEKPITVTQIVRSSKRLITMIDSTKKERKNVLSKKPETTGIFKSLRQKVIPQSQRTQAVLESGKNGHRTSKSRNIKTPPNSPQRNKENDRLPTSSPKCTNVALKIPTNVPEESVVSVIVKKIDISQKLEKPNTSPKRLASVNSRIIEKDVTRTLRTKVISQNSSLKNTSPKNLPNMPGNIKTLDISSKSKKDSPSAESTPYKSLRNKIIKKSIGGKAHAKVTLPSKSKFFSGRIRKSVTDVRMTTRKLQKSPNQNSPPYTNKAPEKLQKTVNTPKKRPSNVLKSLQNSAGFQESSPSSRIRNKIVRNTDLVLRNTQTRITRSKEISATTALHKRITRNLENATKKLSPKVHKEESVRKTWTLSPERVRTRLFDTLLVVPRTILQKVTKMPVVSVPYKKIGQNDFIQRKSINHPKNIVQVFTRLQHRKEKIT